MNYALSIFMCDPLVIVSPFELIITIRMDDGSLFDLRFDRDALFNIASVIHTNIKASLRQIAILNVGPCLTPG
ncbi:hypothetical protein JCM12296A_52520 [Desulfosarcina cetonica]